MRTRLIDRLSPSASRRKRERAYRRRFRRPLVEGLEPQLMLANFAPLPMVKVVRKSEFCNPKSESHNRVWL
jgi:hypothetical protein